MTTCKRAYFSGQVQGVGFRYTAQRLAGGFSVTGYVRNLPDGRVELVAEGPPDQVDAFLAAVGKRMEHYVERTEVEEATPGGYKGFGIRY